LTYYKLSAHKCLHILNVDHITRLSLYNCRDLHLCKDTIGRFTQLRYVVCACVRSFIIHILYRHLDVSQGEPTTGCNYPHPSQTLYEWVSHMPYLEYLDIANTNLADQHGPSFGNNNNNVDECPM
jgi:hypothetical protein